MTFSIEREIAKETERVYGLKTDEIPKSLLKRAEPHVEHYPDEYTQDNIDNHGPRDDAEWAAMRSYNRNRL